MSSPEEKPPTSVRRPVRELLARSSSKLGWGLLGFILAALFFSSSDTDTSSHDGHAHSAADAGDTGTWTCSMHPQIQQQEPGQCPLCGMDLIKATAAGAGAARGGPDSVVLSERARALARLQTTRVGRQSGATASLRLLGRVEPNEESLRSVTAWTGGRIERLLVRATGQRVRPGQAIATLYSPEVFAAHQDLIVARRQVARLQDALPSSQAAAAAALEAARQRLRLIGVPDAELTRMEGSERPTRSISIFSPFGGTVMQRIATEGAYVETGAPLYKVADLRKLWIQLDAYEGDLPNLRIGQAVTVTLEALPGQDFTGKLTFIDPTLDALRRTARVRVEVANPDGQLRPGMFAAASIELSQDGPSAASLVIPETAPLFTGKRAVVYVEVTTKDGISYEARSVRLGPKLGNVYPVIAGLSEGDVVVSRGAFTLDADLQIRGGNSMMTQPDDSENGAWDDIIKLTAEELNQLAPPVERYLEVQAALAADSFESTKTAAAGLLEALAEVTLSKNESANSRWQAIASELKLNGKRVEQAANIEASRLAFEPLSGAIETLLSTFGNPLDKSLRLAFCPMAMNDQGASWIQTGEVIDNSYFGARMRRCGDIRQAVSPGSFLGRTAPDSSTPPGPSSQKHQHQH